MEDGHRVRIKMFIFGIEEPILDSILFSGLTFSRQEDIYVWKIDHMERPIQSCT